ncbi:MAG: hydantoinase/oxoprolinase family protein [Chloroflexi bacterium]|nr:hydantoinase/oxoprolinase family protein [Chloroflexota bacterium]
MAFRLGFDVGGTFTDFALQDERTGQLFIGKCLTTPDDPARGVLEGAQALLEERGLGWTDVHQAIHAATLGANTVIERKGAKTGLITTRGFRDVLEIQRQLRYNIHDLFLDKHPPLVPRNLIAEVAERLWHDGTVRQPLDEGDVRRALALFQADDVQAVAVCLLHAYANPAHERRIGEIVRAQAPHLALTLASDIAPQYREYERASTAVVNAYLQPLMARYIARISDALAASGYRGAWYMMQANGGLSRAALMADMPVRSVESGPAAGVLMAARYGALAGVDDLIAFDMGGTTAKACLIKDRQPATVGTMEIDRLALRAGSGLPINQAGMDLVEIGAGGGSIAHVSHGLLQVGPHSAGADPGPACYGRGGRRPTVTDADVLLGYLNPDYFLGGRMHLDRAAAEAAVGEHVARPLGLGLDQAAWGIYQIANVNMERAIRAISVEQGHDPRTLTLVAFGGAGPLHAARLGRSLGLGRAILPAAAGVTSAIGLLIADVRFDLARTRIAPLGDLDVATLNAVFGELEVQARALLDATGIAGERRIGRSADMRYAGQGYELEITLPDGPWAEGIHARIRAAHDAHYAAVYGYAEPDGEAELVTWKVCALCLPPRVELPRREAATGGLATPKGRRRAYFPEAGGWTDTAIYDRDALRPGMALAGPAVVEERESTTILLPDDTAAVDEYGSLIVTLGGAV